MVRLSGSTSNSSAKAVAKPVSIPCPISVRAKVKMMLSSGKISKKGLESIPSSRLLFSVDSFSVELNTGKEIERLSPPPVLRLAFRKLRLSIVIHLVVGIHHVSWGCFRSINKCSRLFNGFFNTGIGAATTNVTGHCAQNFIISGLAIL